MSDAEAERIEEDIAETRHEMDDTIEALERRLDPRHWLDEAVEYVAGKPEPRIDPATGRALPPERQKVRAVGDHLMQQVRDHPVTAVMVGAGLMYLLLAKKAPPRRALPMQFPADFDWEPSYDPRYNQRHDVVPYDDYAGDDYAGDEYAGDTRFEAAPYDAPQPAPDFGRPAHGFGQTNPID